MLRNELEGQSWALRRDVHRTRQFGVEVESEGGATPLQPSSVVETEAHRSPFLVWFIFTSPAPSGLALRSR